MQEPPSKDDEYSSQRLQEIDGFWEEKISIGSCAYIGGKSRKGGSFVSLLKFVLSHVCICPRLQDCDRLGLHRELPLIFVAFELST